jgi:hypothetical protein
MTRKTTISSLTLILLVLLSHTAKAQLFYSEAREAHFETFDGMLASNDEKADWVDGITLPGWKAFYTVRRADDLDSLPGAPPFYLSSNGSVTATHLYSYGRIESKERALGIIPGKTKGSGILAIGFRNKSGQTLKNFQITYDGEQWRVGGETLRILKVDYKIGKLTSIADGIWTNLTLLDFQSPQLGLPRRLDGNSPDNKQTLTQTVSGVNWKDDTDLWIRFVNQNLSGGNQGLAIDNFSFTAE